MSRILIEVGVAGSYFDGGSSPDPDLTPAWTGAANGSPSVLVAAVAANSGANYGLRAFRSARWAKSGGYSLRQSSFQRLSGERMSFLAGGFSLPLGMVPGRTYTILASAHIEEALQNVTSGGPSLRLRVNGSVSAWFSAQAFLPTSPGDYERRLTVTIPPGVGTLLGAMIQSDVNGTGDIWWDNLVIVEGVYSGPYRDGGHPGWAWLGAPGWSQSAGPGGL